MRSSYSGKVMGPKISSWILPRMFMPAPWITRILGMCFLRRASDAQSAGGSLTDQREYRFRHGQAQAEEARAPSRSGVRLHRFPRPPAAAEPRQGARQD